MSTRQLERLFRRYLNRSPKRYYMELRLQKARNLLMQTDMSVINVALACGFASPVAFLEMLPRPLQHDALPRAGHARRRRARRRRGCRSRARRPGDRPPRCPTDRNQIDPVRRLAHVADAGGLGRLDARLRQSRRSGSSRAM